jgi:hypothetical protein
MAVIKRISLPSCFSFLWDLIIRTKPREMDFLEGIEKVLLAEQLLRSALWFWLAVIKRISLPSCFSFLYRGDLKTRTKSPGMFRGHRVSVVNRTVSKVCIQVLVGCF